MTCAHGDAGQHGGQWTVGVPDQNGVQELHQDPYQPRVDEDAQVRPVVPDMTDKARAHREVLWLLRDARIFHHGVPKTIRLRRKVRPWNWVE